MNWIKLTEGIRYRKHPTRKAAKDGVRKDRYFAIYYRLNGKQKNEGLGWESDRWTEEKVKLLYSELKQNRKTGIGPKTYEEKRNLDVERHEQATAETKKEEKGAVTVSTLFNGDYLKLATTDKAKNTVRREKYLFRDYIQPIIGDIKARDVNKGDIEAIKAGAIEGGLSAASVNLVLATIRQILNFAIDQSIIETNPVSKVKKLKLDNRRVRFLTEAEAETLLTAIKEKSIETYRITLFSLHMGLRAGEIFNLAWADINLENGSIFIKDTKTGHNRHAYMTDRVRAELGSMETGQGKDLVFSPREYAKSKHIQMISKTFMRAVNGLKLNEGIKDARQKIVFHSCRHSYASWLVQKGVSIYVVKELLGHRTLTMTERYSHVAGDHLRQAAAILDGESNVIPFPKQEAEL